MVARGTVNPQVAGSNPARGATRRSILLKQGLYFSIAGMVAF